MVSAFGDHSIKSFLPQNFLTPCLYIYSSSTSIISFKFLIHMEFILVYGTKQESKFSPCPLHLPWLLVPNLFDSGTYCSQFLNKQSQKGRSGGRDPASRKHRNSRWRIEKLPKTDLFWSSIWLESHRYRWIPVSASFTLWKLEQATWLI